MASFRVLTNIAYITCFIAMFSDITLGNPILSLNGTDKEILPTENNLHMLNISKSLLYEGKSYSEIYISIDGIVGFSDRLQYRGIDWSQPAPFIDKPFIAPYHYDGAALNEVAGYTGHVHYKELLPTNTDGSQNTLLALGQYTHTQVVGSRNFDPTWGLVVTWRNVTSNREKLDGSCKTTTLDPCRMNTFQLILLSDETESYAIFNYGAMNIPIQKYDQAGFNGGDGSGWTNVLNHGVGGLSTSQGSDTVGRYIFKISAGKIVRGGCSTDRMTTSLSVYPSYAGMYGGKMVDVSGPCFSRNMNIKCKFGQVESAATFVSKAKARCVVPRLLERGQITLSVAVDGNLYAYHAQFFIVYPDRVPTDEHVNPVVSTSDRAWYDTKSATLELRWDPLKLSNLTAPQVDITLFGYREHNGRAQYESLLKLGSKNVGSGSYSFDSDPLQCKGATCSDYELGLLEVKLQDGATPMEYKFLSSKAIPLGWYVHKEMTSQYGANWPGSKCTDWYNADRQNMTWLTGLPSCPCTLAQSIADFGRWQPDLSCNQQRKDEEFNCVYHTKAVQCARSVQPVGGAGTQCCYDERGRLLYSADSFQGSTPDRSHDWGTVPYLTPGRVPALSHKIKDVISFYYCCLWTEYSHCDYYMDQRPTTDCTGYTPPALASAFGQGHLITFGGVQYRILGPGDYTLLKADTTTIQARFERNPFPNENGVKITTSFAMTAIVIQDVGSSSKVEIRLRGPDYTRQDQKLDVRVDGQYVSFGASELLWQDFQGVTVVNSLMKVDVQSNYTIMMRNGIGLQVVENAGTLQLDVNVPKDTFTNVSGLFGDVSSNTLYPNGSYADIPYMLKYQTPASFYNTFQLAWAVKEGSGRSLFAHILPANHSLLGPLDFNPTAMPGTSGGAGICSPRLMPIVSKQCMDDYKSTGSRAIAKGTVEAEIRHMSLTANLQFARSCGLLNVPRAKKDHHDYILGSQVTVTGCRSGSLSGHAIYQCLKTSNTTQAWSPAVTATCEVQTDDANVGMIVGIVIACVAAVAIIVVIGIICFRRRRQYSVKKRSGSAQNEAEQEAMKTDV